jgi:hypothetical protein
VEEVGAGFLAAVGHLLHDPTAHDAEAENPTGSRFYKTVSVEIWRLIT